jgi:hypothetical protein
MCNDVGLIKEVWFISIKQALIYLFEFLILSFTVYEHFKTYFNLMIWVHEK